jgi:hypothetical protein
VIADTDAVLLALRCMFSERPHTQDLGAESQARLLWVYGWLHWSPRTELVERALEALGVESGKAA